jgi:hypothetical protein
LLRSIVLRKMEGYPKQRIAERRDGDSWIVARRLELIRHTWQAEALS